ncbi:MAG: hypothetical protein K6E49_07180 [Lachnospiraceae bacterium]|nr:hypothetical protein [Lachnospiraceae bacterium]
MGRYHWVRLYALTLMIVLFALSVFVGISGAYDIIIKSARQRSIVRSVESIERASDSIIRAVSDIAKDEGHRQYEIIRQKVKSDKYSAASERELEMSFRNDFSSAVIQTIGEDAESICDTLDSYLESDTLRNVSIQYDPKTCITEEKDSLGKTSALRIKNVIIRYDNPIAGERTETFNYNIQFPDVVFHAGNDEIFRYCMIAGKGIYMTGPTSSVIGDVYAGIHSPEECREAEIEYGETGTYGGINILSTQLGIRSDRIITRGDININGSFVVFSPNEDELKIYAQRINEIEGFSKDTQYTLDGKVVGTYNMDDDDAMDYREAVRLVEDSLSGLDPASIYYDSDNDSNYNGSYRKLISGTDVELTDDFRGIIVTRANVIIRKDVNFEGVILSGDRIYTMGNNNIVADPAVARAIVEYEFGEDYMFRVKDYIKGMNKPGITDPDYYVIPYHM